MFASRFSRSLTARNLSRTFIFSSQLKAIGCNSTLVALIQAVSIASVGSIFASSYIIYEINWRSKIRQQQFDELMRELEVSWRQRQEYHNKIQNDMENSTIETESRKLLPSYKCYLLPAAAASMLAVVLYASAKR